uniref:Uncharacterized protein n=1 Tax=viral metagenome TaxID=1070528 RepID=A0A6H1ZX28_9ZZZZ
MPREFPFPHQGPVSIVADDRFEVAYYARDYLKFKRVREIGTQTWQDTIEQEIDQDHFWMVRACIERGKLARHGLV